MGTLVRFPRRKANSNRKQLNGFTVERLPDHQHYYSGGDLRFTCAACGHTARFSFTGLVFKECRFYCSQCGTGYKVDNPLFANKNKSRSK